MERREYIAAINNIIKELSDVSVKAVYEMALICRTNDKKEKNSTKRNNKIEIID